MMPLWSAHKYKKSCSIMRNRNRLENCGICITSLHPTEIYPLLRPVELDGGYVTVVPMLLVIKAA
jgi:hypothetical protein